MNKKVDFFFEKAGEWKEQVTQLRELILQIKIDGEHLEEELKWGCPAYTFQGKNIVLIHHFKSYCALLLFKGALLDNSHGLLTQQTENVQSARQIRFTQLSDILENQELIENCIREAVEVEKSGLKVELKKTKEFEVAIEFKQKLTELPELRTAFEQLTPGRQRAYLLHFSSAKQPKTRISRIESCVEKILNGKGLLD